MVRQGDHMLDMGDMVGAADDGDVVDQGPRGAIEHRVKSWPHLFEATLSGAKTHEMRRASDRDYRTGDTLLLQEYDQKAKEYTGRQLRVRVTYVTSASFPCALSGDGLHPDYCILSIKPMDQN